MQHIALSVSRGTEFFALLWHAVHRCLKGS
jgi:hypothetical protein